uniref:Pathogenesis related protein I n=1 Tax=Santalum album TaxID=35974 RepID=O22479_SANAL|nr:pathogenesis related protein I [Santalum album]
MGGFSLASAFLLSLWITGTIVSSRAQNSAQDYSTVPNVRAVGVEITPWDEQRLAASARQRASDLKTRCRLVHSHSPYGENLAITSGHFTTFLAFLPMWVVEKFNYAATLCVCHQAALRGCARKSNGGTKQASSNGPTGVVPY